jgi:hypothetical protein
MEENDQVDVFIEQQGGGDEEEGNEPITIKVKESTGDEMQFKVKKSTRMAKIFDAYAGEDFDMNYFDRTCIKIFHYWL